MLDHQHQIAVDRVLGVRELCTSKRNPRGILPFGKSCLYDMIKRGEFPAPVKLSAGRVGWTSRTVAAWLDSRPATAAHRAPAASTAVGG